MTYNILFTGYDGDAIYRDLVKLGTTLDFNVRVLAPDRKGAYEPTQVMLEEMANVYAGQYAAVIIAHNEGVGAKFAELIPDFLRDNTMVVLGGKLLGDAQNPYLDHGINKFYDRTNFGMFRQGLEHILGLN